MSRARRVRDDRGRLAPLVCRGCGAPVAVDDADEIACAHCGARCRVPEAHRRAVALSRAADSEVARAAEAWRRFDRATLPRFASAAIGQLPGLVFVGGAAIAVLAKVGAIDVGSLRRFVALGWWLPLAPTFLVTAVAWWQAQARAHVPVLRAALAAVGEREPRCRQCAAPLPYRRGDVICRCVYCRTDSLVTLSARRERAIAKEITTATASAADAVAASAARRGNASAAVVGLGVIFGALCLPPILYGLGAPLSPSDWMLLPVFLVAFFALAFGPLGALDLYGRNEGAPVTVVALGSFLSALAFAALFAWVTPPLP